MKTRVVQTGIFIGLLLWAADGCITMPETVDEVAPALSNLSIAPYSIVSGTVVLSVDATDNRGISEVQFLLDDVPIARLQTAPYRYSWATNGVLDGAHLLSVVARDLTGNESRQDLWISILNGTGTYPPYVEASGSLDGVAYSGAVTAQRGQTVYFRVEAFDPDGGAILYYEWDFGDGSSPETGVTPSHIYSVAGNFEARVTVRDDEGSEATATILVTVVAASGAPIISQFSVSPTSLEYTGLPVRIDVSAMAYDPDGSVVTYAWDFGDGSPVINQPAFSHDYRAAGPNYRVTLRVTDEQNETTIRSTIVTVSSLPLLGMADDFETIAENGQSFRLSDRRGEVVLLNFWATWCIPCREEFPILENLHQTRGSQGLLVVGIDTADLTRSEQLQTWKQNNPSITYLLALDKGEQYRDIYLLFHNRFDDTAPQSLPYTILIDRGGGVRWTKVTKLTEGEVDSLLNALLPIATP